MNKFKKVFKFDVEKFILHIIMNNYNEYNIFTLNTQILQSERVNEKYYLMKSSKIYLTSL